MVIKNGGKENIYNTLLTRLNKELETLGYFKKKTPCRNNLVDQIASLGNMDR